MTRISSTPLTLELAAWSSSSIAVPSVAAAMLLVPTWTDLSRPRQQDLLAGLRVVPKVLGRPPETIPLDPAVLAPLLQKASPVALGIRASSLVTYRNSVRKVMRRLGLIEQAHSTRVPLAPAWRHLREQLPDKYLSAALQDFMTHCSERGIAPEHVTNDTVADYYEVRRDRRMKGDARQIVRRVAHAWARAAEAVPGWPNQALTAPKSDFRYSLPFSAYPATFQADVDAFCRRMQPDPAGGLFSRLRPAERPSPPLLSRSLSPATVKSRRTAIRLSAAALVLSGVPTETITDLAFLVQSENAIKILDWHYRRAEGETNDHTGAIAETLRILGKYHVGLTGEALDGLHRLTKCAKPPKQKEMTEKNVRRLSQFESDEAIGDILDLPGDLLEAAEEARAKNRHLDAGWIAQIAVAIEIELFCPLRVRDLTHLRVGVELTKLDPAARGYTHLMVRRTSKTGVPARMTLHKDTVRVLRIYLERFRPALPNAHTDWLFPNRATACTPRSPTSLSTAISKAIYEHTGFEMNVHLFRAFAGALALAENPGATEEVRQLLGHRTWETAMIHYRHINHKAAAERHSERISARREKTRLAAKASRAKPMKSGPKPSGLRCKLKLESE